MISNNDGRNSMDSGKSEDPDYMQSLARGLMVLRVFENQLTVTVAVAAQETQLSRATTRRCLLTLERCGYVSQDNGAFRLRPALLPLARAFLSSNRIVDIAEPFLNRLRDSIGEECSLGILDDVNIIFLARAETSRIVNIAPHVGTALPAYCTSIGRAMLAFLPAAALEDFLNHAPFPKRTQYTVTTGSALRKVLQRVAIDGYASVDQELEIGLRSIAVPVRDSQGAVIAALNVAAPAARATVKSLISLVKSQLNPAAQEIGRLTR
jgi:IclR family transcriptional regulator, pca regulon regulatory protein